MQPIKKKVIAIVGATNAPGRGLVRAILTDSAGRFAARVVTLDVNTEAARGLAAMGAEVVVGHVGAGDGLKSAFTGAYGAFCVPLVSEHPSPQRELAEITAVAHAAKDAGLQHVIWATLGEARGESAKVFGGLGVPTTFLHAFGEATKLRGERVAEEMGRVAYGILKTGEYIGKTVSINAELLTGDRKPTPAIPVPSLAPKAGLLRPRVFIPVLAALAILVFFLVHSLYQPDPNLDPTASIGDAADQNPAPPPHAGQLPTDPPPKIEPITPTVTSKWEQERTGSKKLAMAGDQNKHQIAPPKSPPTRYVKPRKRGRSDPEEIAVEASAAQPRADERPAPPPTAAPSPESPPLAEPGPAPAAPSASSRQHAPPAAAVDRPPGYVDPKGVKATVRANAAQVRTCFERATMEHPELHGRLAIQATVDPSGHVVSATPTSTIEGGARLQACVLEAFQGWTFPAPVGGVKGNITYSFSFE